MTPVARNVVRIVAIVAVVALVALVLRMAGHRHLSASASASAAPAVISPDRRAARPREPSSREIAPAKQGGASGSVEICGKGRVAIDKKDPSATFNYVGTLAAASEARWLTALQNSDDLRARVAGLYFEGKLTGGRALRPVAEQTRNEVVQLAAGSGDPAVYAMALAMCRAVPAGDGGSNCRLLSLRQWARMDADNAAPWLLLAGQARVQHDFKAEAEAFSHAAAAHKMDAYNYSLYAFGEPELPATISPLERAYLATEVFGIEAGIGLPEYSIAGQHCSVEATQSGETRQQCALLADLLVNRGTNLLDWGIGVSIGKHVGWPSERVNKLTLEQHALMQAIFERMPSDEDHMWTCDSITWVNAYVSEAVQVGELAAARALLEHSGETPEAMADKFERHMDKIKQQAVGQPDPGSRVGTGD